MNRSYSNEIYKMYEIEVAKNQKANNIIRDLKLEIYSLKLDLKTANGKINYAIEKATKPLIEENHNLKAHLDSTLSEIKRLKEELSKKNKNIDKDYLIDKLNNQINKDSFNSSIPTSKEIGKSHNRRTNTYNHRKHSFNTTGGQYNHKGITLTKQNLEEKIKKNELEVREIIHYIKGKSNKQNIIKYKVGIAINTCIEKHIFIHHEKANELLPKKFYSDVSYKNDLKAIIVLLGNYCSLPYNKIKEIISNFTNGAIDLSEGTIDNIYTEFARKSEPSILNITKNLLNSKCQHTDETVTSENGKDTYYRGYANSLNVLYKYHHKKGDIPIEEDGILNNYFGTVISDHDTGVFKYGINNQDCIVHFGRYCMEQEQNITTTSWQMDLYNLLLKFERNRKIIFQYGSEKFQDNELDYMEREYDFVIQRAKEENESIQSTYWKEKANTLLNRCIKYKPLMLLYIHDFSVDYNNNFMERALRMIKGKTKVSGGFRSTKGGERFGNIMSIIKTSKLRNINPLNSIELIMSGKTLFA